LTTVQVLEIQEVAPVYPVPPHCPHLATPAPEVGEETGVETIVVVDPPPLPGVVTEPAPKVELMGPHLMLEKVTEALPEADSTSVGAPEVVAQDPRAAPGVLADLVVGY
jgi:hypothetical protein